MQKKPKILFILGVLKIAPLDNISSLPIIIISFWSWGKKRGLLRGEKRGRTFLNPVFSTAYQQIINRKTRFIHKKINKK